MAEAYGDSRNDKPKTSSSRTKSSSSSSSKSSSSSSSSRTKSSSSSGSKSSSSSSAGTAAENAAAKAKAKKVAELKKLAKTVEKTGTELEKTSNYLVEAMQDLKKGLTGASAAVINTITDTAQGAMETISNFLNSTGSKIASDLKSEGEQYAFGKSKVNVEKPTTKGNDVFSCDTDVLKGDVIPRLEKAQNTSGNASNEIAKAPKVQGYEGVSKEAEEINSVGTIIGNIINQVKDIIEKAQQTENKNDGITSALGNTVSSLLGGIVPKASAAEYVPPTTEQPEAKYNYTTDMNDASKDNSAAAQIARDREEQAKRDEAKRKETMAKELEDEGATRGKVPPKDTESSPYNSYDPSRDNSAAAQISRDRDAIGNDQNLKPKNNGQIAHRGYGAEENSEEAFTNAGEAGYWGCETDVRFDSAGNIVCSHGAVGKGEEAVSLERYLEICKEYGMTPVIDIKYEDGNDKQNKELAQKIIEITDKMGMTETTVLQTDRTSDISNIREASDSVEIWYLANKGVSSIDADVIKENNVGGINIKDSTGKNTTNAQQIKDIQEIVGEDIDICIWNVKTTSTKDQVLNKGATYVMSDNKLGVTPYQPGDTDFNREQGNYKDNDNDGKYNLGKDVAKTEDKPDQPKTVTGENKEPDTGTLTQPGQIQLSGDSVKQDGINESIEKIELEIEKIKTNGIYGGDSLAAQISRDKVEELENEKNTLLAEKYGISTTGKTNEEIKNEVRLEQIELEIEKTKTNGIYAGESLAAQISRDKVAELEREQNDIWTEYYGINTKGKTNEELKLEVEEKKVEKDLERIELEIEKIKTNGIYGGDSLAAQISRDKVEELENEKFAVLAKDYGIDTTGKLNSQVKIQVGLEQAQEQLQQVQGELEQAQLEIEKIKASGIYGNDTLAGQNARDEVQKLKNDIEKLKNDAETLKTDQIDLLAKYYGVSTRGKENDEVMLEVANKIGMELTKTLQVPVSYGDPCQGPWLGQQDYEEDWIACLPSSITVMCSLAVGRELTPYEVAEVMPELMSGYVFGMRSW